MFYYYWQERSFYKASLEETEEHLRQLNSIVVEGGKYAQFNKYKGFLDTPYGRRKTIKNLFESITDGQLSRKILPFLLQRIASVDTTFVSLDKMEQAYPKKPSAFMGPKFVNKGDSLKYIVNFNDFNIYRDDVIRCTIAGKNLKPYCEMKLTHVVVTEKGFNMAKSRGSEIRKLFEDMIKLDSYVKEGKWHEKFSAYDFCKDKNVEISDESSSVKEMPKLKEKRHFQIPECGSQYCFLHIKEKNLRIHIYPDNQKRKIYVPYIGNHLPTKKYR